MLPSFKILLVCFFSISALLLNLSCARTRVVKLQAGSGGIIMVQEGIIGDARKDANKLMEDNCGHKKFKILEEGEAKVGQTTDSNTDDTKYGSSTSSSSSDTTEWRLKYKCIGKKGRKGSKNKSRKHKKKKTK